MKIQELEYITGLERPSIRFYEREGLLNPRRLENGYRDYSEEDAALLKKIKLLRRLGMRVERIRELQQGSVDLNTVISQQISFHAGQIEDQKRCKAVCEAMRDDGVEFASMDADRYLRLLREIRIDDRQNGSANFQEPIEKEIHPWRRWFARWLDYSIWGAIVNFILIVVLRIRPIPGDFGSALITVASLLLFVPVEAFLLSKFGTTPGKYAMGIRLEYIQGGNLPYAEALYRSLRVCVGGAAMGLPLVTIIAYIVRYCQLTGRSLRWFARHDEVSPPQEMYWDEETELIYREIHFKRGAALVLALMFAFGMEIPTTADGMKPRHRGAELTIAQISDNYNATLRILDGEANYYDKLLPDGSKKPVSPNTVIVDMNSSQGNHQMQFIYETEADIVRAVGIHHAWDQVFYLQPLTGDPLMMASSILLAQEGCGVKELLEFHELYRSYLDQKSAAFDYRNLRIEWHIEAETEMHDGTILAKSEENVTAVLNFQIFINAN